MTESARSTELDEAVRTQWLTEGERAEFEGSGYLMIRRALDAEQVAALLGAARARDERFRSGPGIGQHHVLNEHDLVGKASVWDIPLMLPSTFAKVVGLMGWNIQLFHTQLLVTPPAPSGAQPGPYGWHQDNNRMNRDLDTALHPMVSLKVGFFLTDLPEPGMGNLCVAPGSHRLAQTNGGTDPIFRGSAPWPAGAQRNEVEITAAAGDAVIFDRRLWHSASTNISSETRVFLTYGYSYRWLRPKSAMHFDDAYAHMSPIKRQLLGFATSANGYYDPTDEDVPLRQWIRDHIGEAAVAP